MQFVVHYTFTPEARSGAQARFAETGAPPPEGVTMTGRWHCAHGREGFLVCESDDAAALAAWIQQWSDLLTFRVLPVVDDQTLAQVIGA